MGNERRSFRRAVKIGALIVGLVLALSVPAIAFADTPMPVYRFFNMKTGTHFYTASETEKASVIANLSATFKYEGVAYTVDTSNPNNDKPLYRFFNFKQGTHFYTSSETEKANVIANLSSTYKYEGIAYYVSANPVGATTVWRFLKVGSGTHFYTASETEKNSVMANLSSVFRYEGVAFYLNSAFDNTPPVTTSVVQGDLRGSAFINLMATDAGSGVAGTYYELHGPGITPLHVMGTTVFVTGEGSYTLYYWSVDAAGNEEAPKTLEFTIVGSHAMPASDCTSDCHSADILTLHKNDCVRCHGEGVTPSYVCADCHDFTVETHPFPAEAHDASASSCTADGCHQSDVTVIHAGPGCEACHGAGKTPTLDCATCHEAPHAGAAAAHVSNEVGCWAATCHAQNDVSFVHSVGVDPPGCAACHAPGVTPSTACFPACHSREAAEAAHNYQHDASGAPAGPEGLSSACVACHGDNFISVAVPSTPPTTAHNQGCFCHTRSYLQEDMQLNDGCVNCHKDSHAPHGFEMLGSGHNTTTFGTRGAFSKFDGSQGVTVMVEAEGPTQGLLRDAAGNVTTVTVIPSASMPATWAIPGEAAFGPVFAPTAWVGKAVAVGDVTTMTTDWDLPTAQVFWASTDPSAPPTAIKGLDWDSVIACQDCHTGLNVAGPHGAAQNWGLDPDYPGEYSMAVLTKQVTDNFNVDGIAPLSVSGIAVRSDLSTGSVLALRTDGTQGPTAIICAKCHDLENQVPVDASLETTDKTPVVGSNTGHNSHHQDATDGSDQCVSCHIGVPHGWKVPRMLVNKATAEAPYLDPKATGTTRTNGDVDMYRWNGTGWALLPRPYATAAAIAASATPVASNITGAYNLEAMQSLSGGDNHWAIKDHPYQQPAAGLNSVNTDNMIYWSEPDCQACNDHPGEGGIRILDAE